MSDDDPSGIFFVYISIESNNHKKIIICRKVTLG